MTAIAEGAGQPSDVDDHDGYSVLISFATREEADIATCALEAEGIPAIVGNGNHARVDWSATLALGGIQVLVPTLQVAEAKAALRERLRAGDEMGRDDYAPRTDRWKAWWLAAVIVAPILFSVALAFTYLAADVLTGMGVLSPE
jgi:hypothetical protein